MRQRSGQSRTSEDALDTERSSQDRRTDQLFSMSTGVATRPLTQDAAQAPRKDQGTLAGINCQFFSPALRHMSNKHALASSAVRVEELLYQGLSPGFNAISLLSTSTEAISQICIDASRFSSLTNLLENIHDIQEMTGVLAKTERFIRALKQSLPASRALQEVLQRVYGNTTTGENMQTSRASSEASSTGSSQASRSVSMEQMSLDMDQLCAHTFSLMKSVAELPQDISAHDGMLGRVVSEFWRRVDPVHGCLTVAGIIATGAAHASDTLGAVSAAAIASLCVAGCAAIDKYADSQDPLHGRLATINTSSPIGREFKKVAGYLLIAYVELDAVLLLVMQAEKGVRALSDDECRRIVLFYESFNSKFTPLSDDVTIQKAFDAAVIRNSKHHKDLDVKADARASEITTNSLPVAPKVRQMGAFLVGEPKISDSDSVSIGQRRRTAVAHTNSAEARILPG